MAIGEVTMEGKPLYSELPSTSTGLFGESRTLPKERLMIA